MVKSCCVPGCSSKGYGLSPRNVDNTNVSFHLFPFGDNIRLKQWIASVNLCTEIKWNPKRHSTICSLHFSPECFDRTGQITRLRDKVVPTIFPSKIRRHRNFVPKEIKSEPPFRSFKAMKSFRGSIINEMCVKKEEIKEENDDDGPPRAIKSFKSYNSTLMYNNFTPSKFPPKIPLKARKSTYSDRVRSGMSAPQIPVTPYIKEEPVEVIELEDGNQKQEAVVDTVTEDINNFYKEYSAAVINDESEFITSENSFKERLVVDLAATEACTPLVKEDFTGIQICEVMYTEKVSPEKTPPTSVSLSCTVPLTEIKQEPPDPAPDSEPQVILPLEMSSWVELNTNSKSTEDDSSHSSSGPYLSILPIQDEGQAVIFNGGVQMADVPDCERIAMFPEQQEVPLQEEESELKQQLKEAQQNAENYRKRLLLSQLRERRLLKSNFKLRKELSKYTKFNKQKIIKKS